MKRIVATLSLLIVFILVGISPAFSAPSFANDKFKTLWSYSDKLVDEIPGAGRGFTWGPNSFGSPIEDYQEGAGGKRQVQYFDKSRMELSANGQFVTNGLLTKELVTGQRQDGDSKFTSLAPSSVQVAGDDNSGGGNAISPTYASFKDVVTFNPGENTAVNQVGQKAALAINKSGLVSSLSNPPALVLIGAYDSVLGHNIPQVFVDFQNQTGKVWNGSTFVNAKIYTDNPIANVFGYAISEAFWARAVVAGQEKDVLTQLFERRVLTYTPSDPDPFKVEMGNIGQHYYKWRYGSATPPPQQTPKITGGVSVSNSNPAQHSVVTVYATLIIDGIPAYPATMNAVFHYKTTDTPCNGMADSNGTASCSLNIGGATPGYTVIINVTTTYKGQNYYGSTSFTPVGSTNPTPTPIPTNPPSTGVTFLLVTGGPPGANAYVKVQTAANASCSISYVTPSGSTSTAQGLGNKSADGSGIVDWTWKIGTKTNPGTGTVTVTCNGVSASTGITIG